jgi:hypothetical protein
MPEKQPIVTISTASRPIKAIAAVAASIVVALIAGLVIAAGIIWAFSQ